MALELATIFTVTRAQKQQQLSMNNFGPANLTSVAGSVERWGGWQFPCRETCTGQKASSEHNINVQLTQKTLYAMLDDSSKIDRQTLDMFFTPFWQRPRQAGQRQAGSVSL